MSVERAVRVFRRFGARCRKSRSGIYVCRMGDVEARISERGITIVDPGEMRTEYMTLHTSDGLSEEDFIRDLIKRLGAKDAYISAEATTSLVIEFSLDQAERAAKVMKALETKNMYIAITNLVGELRTIENYRQVPTHEWIENL